MPWVEEWRLASTTEPLSPPPNVRHLAAELSAIGRRSDLNPHQSAHMKQTRGDLL
jgi:hypothetical protein